MQWKLSNFYKFIEDPYSTKDSQRALSKSLSSSLKDLETFPCLPKNKEKQIEGIYD
jgi:hypothetical protein